jgi:DNA-binding Xre family transcriptional regulator
MAVNYDKLWVILKEREMLKTDLIKAAKISTNAMAKLGKNEDVRIGVLVKICETLKCKLDDIVESCYPGYPFASDEARLECLFKLYEKMTVSTSHLTAKK